MTVHGDLKRALAAFLAFYVAQIFRIFYHYDCPRKRWGNQLLAVEMLDNLDQAYCFDDLCLIHPNGLCCHVGGQRIAHWYQRSIQRDFA